MPKVRPYITTALHLKPSQIAYRIWRKLGGRACLRIGYVPSPKESSVEISRIPVLPELDFDLTFLSRFDVDSIIEDRIELLHHEETVDWQTSWHEPLSTPLWRFNLHYCEYLLPLAKAYLDTGSTRYLDKGKAIIKSWIDSCPRARGGVAWDPYVISMRAVNWLAFYGELCVELNQDGGLVEAFNRSLAEQFIHLSQNLEKDLLANHYLENLKALVILSCYFGDERTLDLALPKLYEQVDEQILPDGMHFELSPMYHKIVLEDLLRVACCLVAWGKDGGDIADRLRLQRMCDALWSLERNVDRTPLFNDSGDNVAKSRDAILHCAQKLLGIKPVYHSYLPDAGYAMLEHNTGNNVVKVIFDAGRPGPPYAMGHAHCDALSFECFVNGQPWIVNCGTYAYQDESRLAFKRTLAHNTIRLDGIEQHECWAPFRIAGFSIASLSHCDGNSAKGELIQRSSGAIVKRFIQLSSNSVTVRDEIASSQDAAENFAFAFGAPSIAGKYGLVSYAPEFGLKCNVLRVEITRSEGLHEIVIPYPFLEERAEASL